MEYGHREILDHKRGSAIFIPNVGGLENTHDNRVSRLGIV